MTRRPRSRRRSLPLGLTAIAFAATVTGCTQATPGQAAPGAGAITPTSDRATTTRLTTATTTSKAKPDGPVAGMSPCELLSEADRAQLGLKAPPEEGTQAYARYCEFSEAEFTASVNIYDELGPDKRVSGAKDRKPVPTVGRHQAQQWIHAAGSCVISLAIGQSSTVDASVADVDGNEQRGCEVALKLAQLVESKLP